MRRYKSGYHLGTVAAYQAKSEKVVCLIIKDNNDNPLFGKYDAILEIRVTSDAQITGETILYEGGGFTLGYQGCRKAGAPLL